MATLSQERKERITPAGLLWTWWDGDPLPELEPIPGLVAEATDEDPLLVEMARLGLEEIQLRPDDVAARRRADHQPYVAHLDGNPVAYGWSAGKEAAFGPQRTTFTVPDRNRYLWGFVTLPPWRGRGIYPRLLQAIIAHERGEAERLWILHRWDNTASARGIQKAGFLVVAQICFLQDAGFGLIQAGTADRAEAGATVLGLPLIEVGSVAPADNPERRRAAGRSAPGDTPTRMPRR